MRMIEGHRSPLERQVHEGVQLELHKADIIMNSKSEWNHARLPRIVIEMGEEQAEDQENGMCDRRRGLSEVSKRVKELGLETDPADKRKSLLDSEQLEVHQGSSKRIKLGCVDETLRSRRGAKENKKRPGVVQRKVEKKVREKEGGTWLDNWIKM